MTKYIIVTRYKTTSAGCNGCPMNGIAISEHICKENAMTHILELKRIADVDTIGVYKRINLDIIETEA